jgi:putative DNA-invertase from lambdoid prophage Rac
MSRTFLYARVSTTEQTTDNQLLEISNAGFAVDPKRTFTESISGSIPAKERPVFQKVLQKMEEGDVLIITKLDRLGRNATDVSSTIKRLSDDGIRVHCLQLGGTDLTSSSGKLIMGVLNSMAEFERDLLIERTQAGLQRAQAEGKRLGRPPAFTPEQLAAIRAEHARGKSICQLARDHGKVRAVIQRALRPSD